MATTIKLGALVLVLGTATLIAAPSASPDDSKLACVRDAVRQGVAIRDALATCHLDAFEVPARTDLDDVVASGPGRVGGAGAVHVQVTCTASVLDGRRADEATSNLHWVHHPDRTAPPGKNDDAYGKWRDYKDLKEEVAAKWAAYYDALTEWAKHPYAEPIDEVDKLRKEANEAIDRLNGWRPKVSKVAPGTLDTCAELTSFVMQCNRGGWKSPDCKHHLDLLRHCSDPAVTDPAPDGEASCGLGQTTVDVAPAQVEKVVALLCSMAVKPAPGEEPCPRVEIDADVVRAHAAVSSDNDENSFCGDDRAQFTEGRCLVTIKVASFGQKTLADVIRDGFERLGGPVIVIPQGGPKPGPEPAPPPGPGPK